MLRKLVVSTAALLVLGAAPVPAAEAERQVTDYAFSFEGPFGSYDPAQLQRGLQVYREICSSCHGLQHVAFRTLAQETGPALSPEAVRAFAAEFEVLDPATGEYRTASPTDHFPHSQVENAPDLSLMAKARVGFSGPYGLGINQLLRGIGGPEYIASFLVGFNGEEQIQGGVPYYYNTAYGGYVAMPQVLYDDGVEYADGTPATAEQMAQDVAAFLMWAAEPGLTERKRAGLVGVILLVMLASLLYLTNKSLWAPVKARVKAS